MHTDGDNVDPPSLLLQGDGEYEDVYKAKEPTPEELVRIALSAPGGERIKPMA